LDWKSKSNNQSNWKDESSKPLNWGTDSAKLTEWLNNINHLTAAVTIEPPFITGEDFNQSGSDPSLLLYNGVLYLTFVDGDYIKVAIVDQDTYTVTSLLRTISAVGASRPKLAFEPATYDGQADLPHVAYTGNDGKVYAYREQYKEDLSIVTVTDEIGVGSSIEVVRIGSDIYHFYVGADGVIYVRKQGEYASALITPTGGTITGVWTWPTPDGRIGLLYTLNPTSGGGQQREAFTELLIPVEFDNDSFELAAIITAVELRQGVFVYNENTEYTNYIPDEKMQLEAIVSAVQLITSVYLFSDSAELTAVITRVLLSKIHELTDSMQLATLITQVILSAIHEFTDSMQLTASITAVTLS
jgi:hypothetical protein